MTNQEARDAGIHKLPSSYVLAGVNRQLRKARAKVQNLERIAYDCQKYPNMFITNEQINEFELKAESSRPAQPNNTKP